MGKVETFSTAGAGDMAIIAQGRGRIKGGTLRNRLRRNGSAGELYAAADGAGFSLEGIPGKGGHRSPTDNSRGTNSRRGAISRVNGLFSKRNTDSLDEFFPLTYNYCIQWFRKGLDGSIIMSNGAHFSPVSTQKASGAIYDQIRKMIVSGELQCGDKLPSERDLMQLLQRSRPTIREALRMLENAGLIQSVPGGGSIVKEPSIASLQEPLESILALHSISDEELFEYRFYMEEMTAAWAAERRTEKDLAALQECIQASEKLVDDLDAFLKTDIHFRVLVAKASHNQLCVVMEQVIYNIVVNRLSEVFSLLSKERRHQINMNVIQDNRRIYEAIEKQDSELARKELHHQSLLFLKETVFPNSRQNKAES